MTFTSVTMPNMTRLHWRFCSLGLLLLLGAACNISHQSPADLSRQGVTNAAAATQTRIVDAVEPIYRDLFPGEAVLRFVVTPEHLYPGGANERQGWVVDCYDEADHDIAHGVWDEQNRRHILLAVKHHNILPSSSPRLSAKVAVQGAKDWLSRVGMAVPQGRETCAPSAMCLEMVWHVNIRQSAGVAMVWMNACTGEVYQAVWTDRMAAPAASGSHPGAPQGL